MAVPRVQTCLVPRTFAQAPDDDSHDVFREVEMRGGAKEFAHAAESDRSKGRSLWKDEQESSGPRSCHPTVRTRSNRPTLDLGFQHLQILLVRFDQALLALPEPPNLVPDLLCLFQFGELTNAVTCQ